MLNLGILFTAKDAASGIVGKLKANYSSLDKTIQDVDKNFTKHVTAFTAGLATMAVGAKIAAIPLGLVDTAGKFESSISKMVSLTGFQGKELERMRQIALTVGPQLGAMPTEMIDGMENLGTAGLNARQTLEAIQPVLLFRNASQGALNMEQAGVTFMAATNSFALGTKNAQKTVDMLSATTAIGTLGFGDMERVIASSGSTAAAAGQKFSTFLASISAIKGQGGTATMAAEELRMAFNTLQSASSITEKALGRMGLKLTDLREAKGGQFLQMPDLLDKIAGGMNKLHGSTAAATQVLRDQMLGDVLGIGGIKAYNKIQAMRFEVDRNGVSVTLKGTQALREQIRILEAAGAGGKFAAKANETYMGSYTGIITKVQALGEAIKITLGTPLLSIVNKTLTGVTVLMTGFLNELQKSPGLAQAVTFGLVALGGALIVIGGAIAAFSGFAMVNGALVVAGTSVAGVLAAIGTAAAAAALPVLGLLAVGALLVAAWMTDFAGLRTWVVGMFNTLVQHVKVFSSSFAEGFNFSGFIESLRPVGIMLMEVFTELGTAIGQVFTQMGIFTAASSGEGLAKTAENGSMLGTALSQILVPALQIAGMAITGIVKVATFLMNAFNMLGGVGRNMIFGLLAVFFPFIGIPLLIMNNWGLVTTVFSSIVGVLAMVGGAISGIFNYLMSGTAQAWAGLVSGITGFFAAIGGAFAQIGPALMGALGQIGSGVIDAFAMMATQGGFSFLGIVGYIGLAWSSIIAGIVGFVASAVSTLAGLGSGAGGVVDGIITLFKNMVSSVTGSFDSLKSMASSAWNFIKGLFSTPITVQTRASAPVISGAGGGSNAPQRTAYASGGWVPGGFPNDRFPASLTSHEYVLNVRDAQMLRDAGILTAAGPRLPQWTPNSTRTVEREIIREQAPPQQMAMANSGPRVVKIYLDRRELASAMIDEADDREARSYIN